MTNKLNLPFLSTAQMIEVDRLMIEEWHISLTQMVENAGRGLAEMAKRFLGGTLKGKHIVVLSGTGNNGGGGMVGARHLHNWGAEVGLILIGSEDKLKKVPAQQMKILRKMGLVTQDHNLNLADLIVDTMIGYGLTGDPRPPVADWVTLANASHKPILALDAPTGLDATTGIPSSICIQATITLTLALPKTGLITPEAEPVVGELFLADISVPPELYAAPSLGLQVSSPFMTDSIVKLQ